MSNNVLTKQARIAELSRKFKGEPILSLNHYVDEEWAREAFKRIRKDGALGIDQVTAQSYAKNLDENLSDLVCRMKSGAYRALPSRRTYIPKKDGSQRALHIPALEDKIAQKMVQMLLEPLYEADFCDCSFGFRPKRSCHLALEYLRNLIMDERTEHVLDVDIKKFFDTVPHDKLREFLRQRVGDGVIRRLIDKWLKAGYVERGERYIGRIGTPAGGIISPLLANIYLHYVLDTWFETDVKPRMKGKAYLVRYCDDFVMLFEKYDDMMKVYRVLPLRLGKYSLTMHETKTQTIDFRRNQGGKPELDSPTSFSFLGFTHIWGKSRRGFKIVRQITSKQSLSSALLSIYEWCKRNRHMPIPEQQESLIKKMMGHYNYFGITGNYRKLGVYHHQVTRTWRKWLSRRDKSELTWEKFKRRILERFPLPTPRIAHQYATNH